MLTQKAGRKPTLKNTPNGGMMMEAMILIRSEQPFMLAVRSEQGTL
jgi:hypothetical protein